MDPSISNLLQQAAYKLSTPRAEHRRRTTCTSSAENASHSAPSCHSLTHSNQHITLRSRILLGGARASWHVIAFLTHPQIIIAGPRYHSAPHHPAMLVNHVKSNASDLVERPVQNKGMKVSPSQHQPIQPVILFCLPPSIAE